MGTFEDFDALLRETVEAKRLSGSKVKRLTELAAKSVESASARLVASLLDAHRQAGSNKISSLYVLEAITSQARSRAKRAPKGPWAGFLKETEGIVDEFYEVLLQGGEKENKEKAKKVLDIWTTSSTFGGSTLARLATRVHWTSSSAAPSSATSAVASTSEQDPIITSTAGLPTANASQPGQLPAGILALLGSFQTPQTGTPLSRGPENPALPTSSNPSDARRAVLDLLAQQPATATSTPPRPAHAPVPPPALSPQMPHHAPPGAAFDPNSSFSPATPFPLPPPSTLQPPPPTPTPAPALTAPLFDWTSFDPASADSWAAAGAEFERSCGFTPSTEQLAFAAMMQMEQLQMAMMQQQAAWAGAQAGRPGADAPGVPSERGGFAGGRGRGRGGGFGRGGGGRGRGGGMDRDSFGDSDAVVLGGGP